jgi:asparagine synthase (glutamine-hydrolysing)
MCGIYGMVSYKFSPEEIHHRLEIMGKMQRHRGPDDQKEVLYPIPCGTVGLGLVRLAILDLETGMQPIHCGSDNTAIVCNGQIYNYIELREKLNPEVFYTRGDIEVALHLYRSKGLDFLNDLNGMYAGAILDPVRSQLILFRDRFGIKPLYYTNHEGDFVFSSEIKPLIVGSAVKKEINQPRLATYFTYRYIPGGETLFKNIRKVPPGSYLIFDLIRREHRICRYWEYRLDSINHHITLDEAAERFHHLFRDAVKLRLRSDVEVGSLISGGIDSSAVSAQAAEFQPSMRLFSIGFEEAKYNEIDHVKTFIKNKKNTFSLSKLYTKNCCKEELARLPDIVRSLEEPISLGTLLPTDMVCEMAGRQLKVVLTGEGADEIFGGYRKFMIESAASCFPDLSENMKKKILDAYPELKLYLANRSHDPAKRYIQNEALFAEDEISRMIGAEIGDNLFPKDAYPFLTGKEDPLNAAIGFESRFRLADYVILRLDRLSMRHSLEARTPFLDYRLAEFAASLPVRFKVNLELDREKFICSYAYKKYGMLDDATARRKKQPFTIPLADWLSYPETLPEILQEILLGDMIRQQGIIDPDVAKKLVYEVSAYGVGPETLVSKADQVFSLIIFSLWYQVFFCEPLVSV